MLRIEDTDQERSKPEFVQEIFDTMRWLGFVWDDEPVFQMKNIKRHQEVAYDLLKKKKAYKCYCTKEELEEKRENAAKMGKRRSMIESAEI